MVSAWSIVGIVLLGACFAAAAGADPLPIIDMHLHALAADDQGPPPVVICAPYESMPARAPGTSIEEYAQSFLKTTNCAHPIWSAKDNDTLREESLAALQRYNIVAVTSGEPELVQKWHSADPKRIIPAILFGIRDAPSIASLRAMYKSGMLKVMGEIVAQYEGLGPNDSRLEPYWKLAEELDIPVGIHIGPGPPGAAYLGMPKYRARLSDPLLLEDVLVRHPRLRLYVMHAGWPMIDRMIALLYAHPQVYVDLAVIDYTQPRAEFHRYLQRLFEAGYGKRVMFGSDQMVWPEAIGFAIDGIQSAAFLTQEQKRDILHDNAARFLRLGKPPG
jgi:predicted TIM-barrel fold metal-dependent hydrolase